MKNTITDKRKIKSIEKLTGRGTSGLCTWCGERPIVRKKFGLCSTCYNRMRTGHKTPAKPTTNPRHIRERDFVKAFFNGGKWTYQPATFRVNGANYTPDFYDHQRNVFIEVIGSRQAFMFNRLKYEVFAELYPNITLEFRLSDGTLLSKDGNGHYVWKPIVGRVDPAILQRLNIFDRFGSFGGIYGEHHKSSKLIREQVIAIRKDPRTLAEIAKDYGIHWQQVNRIKHHKTWAWLDPHMPIDDRNNPLDRSGQGRKKLTNDQAAQIRKMSGTCEGIGNVFGVSAIMVSKIKRGLIYKEAL